MGEAQVNEIANRGVKLYFDGGCRPNPGAMETAVVLRGVAHVRRDIGHGDNEQAEWLALLDALDIATAQGLTDIILIGDALGVIRQAQGRLRGRQPWLDRFTHAARGFARIRLRHAGRKQNLAGIALERSRHGS